MGLGEIRSNWAQFLAIIAIGAIAVTLFVGLLANAEVFALRVSETYTSGNMADIWVTTSSYDANDEEELCTILGERGTLDSRFEVTAQAGSRSVYMIVEEEEPSISKPYDLESSDQESSSNYVRIDEALSGHEKDNDGLYDIGMPLDISLDLSSFLDSFSAYTHFISDDSPFSKGNVTLSFTITGTMKYPENICKAAYNSSAVLISNDAFMEVFDELLSSSFSKELLPTIKIVLVNSKILLFKEGKYFLAPNQYLVKANSEEDVSKIQADFDEYFAKKDSSNLYSLNNRENMAYVLTVESDVNQAMQFTFLFPFVFFFVALLVILTTTSQLVLKERGQIGTMKALGLKKREILLFFMGITFVLVALGTLIGEILGPIIIPAIMNQKYAIIYTLPSLTYHFPVLDGVLTAVIFLGVSVLVTYLVAHKEASLKPTESMRPKPAKLKAKESKKAQSPRLLSLRMAFRNMRIDLVKSIMVVVGVLGCTALLVCGFGIEDTVNYGVDHDMRLANSADITLSLSSKKTREAFTSDIDANEDIASFQLYTKSTSLVSSSSGLSASSNVFIIEPSTHEHFFLQGEMEHDGIALSTKIAETISANKGDTITFTYGSLTYQGEIYSVFDAFVYNGVIVYADSKTLALDDYLSYSYSGIMVDLKENVDPNTAKSNLTSSLSYILSAQTQNDWQESLNDIMSGVLIMTTAVKVFAILLALVVLYNLALMNFKERQRDIATLKVLGFNLKEIGASLLFEAMTLTAIGVILGLFIGVPFLYGVLTLNKVEIVMYIIHVDALSFVISFLLTFGVAFLINLFFARKARRVKMVESLKSVE